MWQDSSDSARSPWVVEQQIIRSIQKNPYSLYGLALRAQENRDSEPKDCKADDVKERVHTIVSNLDIVLENEDVNDDPTHEIVPTTAADEVEYETEDVSAPNYRPDGDVPNAVPSTQSSSEPKKGGLAALLLESRQKESLDKSPPEADLKRPRHDTAEDNDSEEDFEVMIPGTTEVKSSTDAPTGQNEVAKKHPSQMSREEFLSQFKRAPRRGEIGRSAEEITAAESLGYVMSGSRSKAAQLYVDRVQRQLHEREASKLQQQFRKVEDEREDGELVKGLAQLIDEKVKEYNS